MEVIICQIKSKTIRDHIRNNNCAIQPQNDYNFEHFIQVIKFEKENQPKTGLVNYVKLHGSAHWQHSEGRDILISGVNKKEKISNFNLLQAEYLLFEKICDVKDLQIVIVGYGFRDPHVNETILSAVENGARLYIVNTMPLDKFFNNNDMKFYGGGDGEEKKITVDKAVDRYFSCSLERFINSDYFKNLQNLIMSKKDAA